MSGETIRDVVVRIALETKSSFSGGSAGTAAAKELDELNNRAKEAKKSIDATHASMQQMMQNPLFRGIHHGLVTGSPVAGLHAGANMAVNNAVSPAFHSFASNPAMMANVARIAGPVAAVAGGLIVLSSAIQSTVESLRKYEQALIRGNESAGNRMFSMASAQLSGSMGMINAKPDISHFTTMAWRERSRISTEESIRREQAKIAHRPLEEREALRARMESENEGKQRAIESDARMKHLDKRAEEVKAAREKAELDLQQARESAGKAQDEREGHTNKQQPTLFGRLALKFTNVAGLGAPAYAADHGVANRIASSFGGITPNVAAERAGESGVEGKQAQEKSAAAEEKFLQEKRSIEQQSLEIDKERASEMEKRLGQLREEVGLIRQQAQAAAEGQRNTERSFGALSPGMQARLRRIQAKADRGETLNYRERGLAIQHHINAEDEANAQNESIANRPENAGLFSRGRGRVNDLQQKLGKAEGDQEQEQKKMDGLVQRIHSYSQGIKDSAEAMGETAASIAELSKTIVALSATLEQLKISLETFKDKIRSGYGN